MRTDKGWEASIVVYRGLSVVFALWLIGLSGRTPAEELGGVFVMRPDGSEVRKVIAVEDFTDHGSPRWSHDGRRLVFNARVGTAGARSCFVVNRDGSGLQELCQGRVPDWSSDDKQIVFQLNAAPQVYVQNLDGSGRTQVATGYSPRWDSTGERLAMSDRRQLRVLNLLSGEETGILAEPQFDVFDGFCWSPDDKQLAVVTRPVEGAPRRLLLVDVAGERPAVQLQGESEVGGWVSFSPDGKQIAYADGWKIHLIDVDGKGKPKLIPGQQGLNRHPDWSPDGKWIVFVSTREDVK